MQRRRLSVVVVAVALVIAVIRFATLSDEPPEAASRAADDTVAAPERPRTKPARRIANAPPASEDGSTEQPAASAEPDGSSLFPELLVEVEDCDGNPVRVGSVWATRSDEGPMSLPVVHGELGATGTCRLRLPGGGTYDIAASDGEMLGARARNVDIATTTSVKIALPRAAELRFIREGEDTQLQGNATISQFTPAATSGDAAFSSWDDADLIEEVMISLGSLPLTLRTVAGKTFRYRRGVDPSVAAPDVFSAPATVVIGRPKWGSYRLLVSVEPADRTADRVSLVSYKFSVVGGDRVDEWDSLDGRVTIPAGARVSDIVRFQFHQTPPAPHSIVHWSGRGFHSGSASIDVGESGGVDVPVVLRLDDGPLPTSAFVACVDGPAGTKAEVWIVGAEGRADSAADVEELGRDQTIDFPPGWTPRAVVAAAPGLVAAPQHLRIGKRHEFRLVPGGFLRILRGVRPPDGVDLRVHRRGGLPLRSDAAGFGKPGSMAYVELNGPAVVVGPFVPGDVDLVVVCGTTVLAEFTAHVVARETTDVRLPLADRLPRR